MNPQAQGLKNMKKTIILLAIMFLAVPVYAAYSPDVRIGAYDSVNSSRDTIGSAGTPARLSANQSQPCLAVKLCTSRDTIGTVVWGGSNVNAKTGPGIILASCDTVYVDNVQDIYIDSDVSGAQVSYNWFK